MVSLALIYLKADTMTFLLPLFFIFTLVSIAFQYAFDK